MVGCWHCLCFCGEINQIEGRPIIEGIERDKKGKTIKIKSSMNSL